eukprot:Amastigsp_a341915_4.p4 type:complete len:101 gc:universal Amastigsp_a341915_4:773-1075(+)
MVIPRLSMNESTDAEHAAPPTKASRSWPPNCSRILESTSRSRTESMAESSIPKGSPANLCSRCLVLSRMAAANRVWTMGGELAILLLTPSWIRLKSAGTE